MSLDARASLVLAVAVPSFPKIEPWVKPYERARLAVLDPSSPPKVFATF